MIKGRTHIYMHTMESFEVRLFLPRVETLTSDDLAACGALPVLLFLAFLTYEVGVQWVIQSLSKTLQVSIPKSGGFRD